MSYPPYKTEEELLERLRPLVRYTDLYLQHAIKRELMEVCEARKIPVTEEIKSLIAFMTVVLLPQAVHETGLARTDQILELIYHRHPEMEKELRKIPEDLAYKNSFVDWAPGYFEVEEDYKIYMPKDEK